MTSPYDALVIGAGITGLTASLDLARRGYAVANVEASMFGGLVINVNALVGAIEGSGSDLASDLMTDLSDAGAATLAEPVRGVATDGELFAVETDGATHRARAVLVASGATLRRLGVPGEAEFEYRGVSRCADCDGPMCMGRDVVVVGGGDSALQEALVLAEFCRAVHLVHRRSSFRARPAFVDAVAAHERIEVRWDTTVDSIVGDDTVAGVRLRSTRDGAVDALACAGVFVYVGLEPTADFLGDLVERDAVGAIMTTASLATRTPGLYAAGAVRAGYRGTVDDAMTEARAAARAIAARLSGNGS